MTHDSDKPNLKTWEQIRDVLWDAASFDAGNGSYSFFRRPWQSGSMFLIKSIELKVDFDTLKQLSEFTNYSNLVLRINQKTYIDIPTFVLFNRLYSRPYCVDPENLLILEDSPLSCRIDFRREHPDWLADFDIRVILDGVRYRKLTP